MTAVCKTVGFAYPGSNPGPATTKYPGQTWLRSVMRFSKGAVRSTAPLPAQLRFLQVSVVGWRGRPPLTEPTWRMRGEVSFLHHDMMGTP